MVLRPRNGLSLCAGGGGLDMGLMLAEPGFHARAFVEWEDWPRTVLIAAQRAGYFAPAPIWDDLRSFDARPFRGAFDAVLAGYPCQPFSHAGQRRGEDDPRHLWPHVARVVDECRPEWAFLENVAGHVTLGAETVLRELRDMGYTAAAGLFSAAETGAPHERLRWFCVAHRDTDADTGWVDSRRTGRSQIESQGQGEQRERFRAGPGGGGDELADAGSGRHGGPRQRQMEQPWRAETVRAGDDAGNAARFGRGEGWTEPVIRGGRDTPSGAGSTMADASGAECQGEQPGQRYASGWQEPHGYFALSRRTGVHPPGPADMGRWRQVIATAPNLAPAAGLADCLAWASNLAASVEEPGQASPEPDLRRMADGLALRSRALRLLGNGVHPLAAANAWRSLAAAHGLRPVDLEADGTEGSGGTDEFSMMAAPNGADGPRNR